MFWSTFVNLQLSPDQLRPHDGCLVGVAGDHMEVRGYVDLRTTPSANNLLLGRPFTNRLGAVASIKHMKMRLPSEEGKAITIRSNQKAARKCYES